MVAVCLPCLGHDLRAGCPGVPFWYVCLIGFFTFVFRIVLHLHDEVNEKHDICGARLLSCLGSTPAKLWLVTEIFRVFIMLARVGFRHF